MLSLGNVTNCKDMFVQRGFKWFIKYFLTHGGACSFFNISLNIKEQSWSYSINNATAMFSSYITVLYIWSIVLRQSSVVLLASADWHQLPHWCFTISDSYMHQLWFIWFFESSLKRQQPFLQNLTVWTFTITSQVQKHKYLRLSYNTLYKK